MVAFVTEKLMVSIAFGLIVITFTGTQERADAGHSSTTQAPLVSKDTISMVRHYGDISRRETMENREIRFKVPERPSLFDKLKTIRRDPLLLSIEKALRCINVWENPKVQHLYQLARFGTNFGRRRALQLLAELIQDYQELEIRQDDSYMPYATAEQISNGGRGIHILDQIHNNIPMYAPDESLPLCWLILGPQGGGKSSAVFNMLSQFNLPILILDPKGTWRFRAHQLKAKYIDAEHLSFDLDNPSNVQLPLWLYAYMEGVAYATGLQYGLTYLYRACDLALEQRQRYIERTGEDTPLCLKDIYMALHLCTADNPKQAQYLESAKTALELLLGKGELFANRGGLPLHQLLSGKYILGCRYPTAVQSRLLGWHILIYEYFSSFKLPETTQPRGVIVFDDSSKFVSRPDSVFGTGPQTSIYLHVLSTLRSTGRSAIFADQLVEPICDDVKQLCNNWLVVGGMRGTHNQNEIASAMSLSREQTEMLGKLQTREAVCFCPKLYPRAVHGFIPIVPEPEGASSK